MNVTPESASGAVKALAGQEWTETLGDGSHVLIRPIRSMDADLERAFIERLSPESRRMRFLGGVGHPDDAMIQRLVDIDPEHEVALVALVHREGEKREVGVARFSQAGDSRGCEVAVTVDEAWRGKGLAVTLMQHLIDIARKRGFRHMYSIDDRENQGMKDLAAYLHFSRELDPEDPHLVVHRLEL